MNNFEKDLRTELQELTEFNGKVFPIVAPEQTTAPFLVYKKNSIQYVNTLNGPMIRERDMTYGLIVIAGTYTELTELTDKLTDKVKTFSGRPLGANGTVVRGLSFEHQGDDFVPEAQLFRTNLLLTVTL